MNETRTLERLARAWGVKVRHTDISGAVRAASPEGLLAVLRSLGAPVLRIADATGALREFKRNRWAEALEPASVVWDGRQRPWILRLPAALRSATLSFHIEFEGGDVREGSIFPDALRLRGRTEVEGQTFVALALRLPGPWPIGYHRVRLAGPGLATQSLVIAAPGRAAELPSGEAQREWGCFAPLYAVHGARSWGAGNFSDLATLAGWTADLGGRAVGTLPLLAAFLDEPLETSPYRPVSRMAWNEFYIDVMAVPDLARSPATRALIDSPEFQAEMARLRADRDVDWKRGMALRRRALESMTRGFFAEPSPRLAAFERFLVERPDVAHYARFRALRDGADPAEGDFDLPAFRYHAYVQWLAAEQLGAASASARGRGVRLYLDLPLGVHPDGFDAWRERASFVQGASVGAPPDALFPSGQDWGFAPEHPHRMREQGYRSFRGALGHAMRVASYLRIDHVMSLHRLFWIPQGCDSGQGVYVRYPAEELYAVLALESQRHGCVVVGEDLGLVPPQVRRAMDRHGLLRTSVFQASCWDVHQGALDPSIAVGAACLGTHDMPPFASFWNGLDIDLHVRLGHLDGPAAAAAHAARADLRRALIADLRRGGWLAAGRRTTGNALAACLRWLAASPAPLTMINLEDLCLETRGHNVPGTRDPRLNWCGRMRHPLERLMRLTRVRQLLAEVARGRRNPDA